MLVKRGVKAWATMVAVCSLMLAGCSNGEGTGASTASSSASTATQDEPIKIKWMVPSADLTPDSRTIQVLQEKFNVQIDYYSIPQADYVQKQQILLTSGDVPDVMFVFDPNQLFKYASQGLIAELPIETIEQYAPKTKEVLDSFAKQGWYYTNLNGKNYGLPTTYYTGQFNAKQGWRVDLLKKAGVDKIPETIDEMTDAFAKLKDIGVYGMTTNGNSYYFQFWSIFGAYGVMPTQWMLKDGKVVNGAVVPEAKEALTLLADWYAKGYIDPEFVTGKDMDKKLIEGKIAYTHATTVSSFDLSNPQSTISSMKNINADADFQMAPLPKGPDGQQGGWAWGTAGSIFAFGKQMEQQPEKVKKVLEIMEAMRNDEQVFLDAGVGIKGTHWDYNTPSDPQSGIKFLPPYDDTAKLATEGLKSNFDTLFAGGPAPAIFAKALGQTNVEQSLLYNKPIWDIFGKSDVLPLSGKYWADLTKLKLDAYAQIVRGDKPISYFDDFVKQWNDMGGAELEKEANELYQSVQGNN
ncbi:extracellular solute-binding protein [Cohnella fermenti]|uniref:Extracellular solute-binding protein n=1 Tax=Cohnella fermenti TaxID=2565925 RepID=A0A4S4CAT9_9BACL|nr:extracellular solute-binding protein [Cohnella fermenti]THF84578.1 extracellular solute-binding protein [Cohnella fermenti]